MNAPAQTAASVATAPAVLLDVNCIEVIYNHVILVLKGVSLQVPEGKIVALLGANGAGKTTTLRAVSNLLRGERGEVTKGNIVYRGQRIDRLTPSDLVRRGVVQVMEGRHCFAHLSIEDNLLTGAYTLGLGRAALAQALERELSVLLTRRARELARSGAAPLNIEFLAPPPLKISLLNPAGRALAVKIADPDGARIPPGEARRFAAETGVDWLSVAIGNIHGAISGAAAIAVSVVVAVKVSGPV